jgi:hypothetical protein
LNVNLLGRPGRRFVCLTDTPMDDVNSILLRHNWPGWWSKLECFSPGTLTGRVLYVDLDTRFVSNADDMVTGHRFTVLRNFWARPGESWDRIGSGLMAWSGDLSDLYLNFAMNPKRWMQEPQTKDNWGDQGFIQRHSPVAFDRWQDKHPGRVVSYRKDVEGKGVPKGASVVCFGGNRRPWKSELWEAA